MRGKNRATNRLRSWQFKLLGAGIVALVAGRVIADPEGSGFYCGWLIGHLLCWEATLGCLTLLMLHHLMGGNWGRAAREVLEAGVALLPLVALAFLPIALNLDQIFPWAGEAATEDPLLQHKLVYLNEQAYWTRAVLYFGVWILLWQLLAPGWSRASATSAKRLRPRLSAVGAVLLVVTVSFAAIDWGMSLEPHWFSAIYGAIFVAGGALSGIALAILAVSIFRAGQVVPGISRKRIRNDLGSLLLAMLMIWMYFSFSQFLIIWSANLPEESVWYLTRQASGWQFLALLVVALQFVVPFSFLLSQAVRMHPRALSAVAGLVLLAHALFMLWTIAPAFYESMADIPWTVVATPLGMICLWGAAWLFLLERQQVAHAGKA